MNLYNDMDLNHDGQVTVEEFKASLLVRVKACRAEAHPSDADLKALDFAWAHILEEVVSKV